MKTGRANSPIDQHISARLRIFRKESGKSQSDLAKALGVSFQQVQKYESGKNRISAGRLFEISGFFGVDVRDFYPGFDD